MAEALIAPAVDLILSQLVSGIGENINLIIGFEKELGRLKDEVEMIQAVLHDAERRSTQDEAVKLWLKKLTDFAYVATDVLDEFAYHGLRRKVKKVSTFKPSFLSKRKMGKKIKKLLASLEKINKQASDYGLQRGGGDVPPPRVPEDRETTSLVDVSEEIVGREDDTIKIVHMLTSESHRQTLSVLPIVGMGGQGKTTLAKQIYNHDGVKEHFQKRMWVCVSNEFNVKKLLKCILESLVNKRCELDAKERILIDLQEALGGQNYLLVLDDVWEENRNKWDEFTSDLQSVNTSGGNNIVVTTRSNQVGKLVGTFDQPYSLKELSDDNCWSIFSARAFPHGVPRGFKAIGEEIVKNCRGLPLAAKVVGSMLRSKTELHEWRSIATSGVWNSNDDDSGVLPTLRLSYDNLSSSSLKHCFSYCSIFRKDSVMEKDELIQLWSALGYLQSKKGHDKKMEEIGEMYFNKLVQSSLFQDIGSDFYGNATSCKMHDLVHDLAQFVSKPNVFIVEGSTKLEREEIPRDVRHLALYFDGEKLDTVKQDGVDKLHTLFFGHIEVGKGFMNFKRLRILKLHRNNELPTSISELIHLRYLDLSNTRIKVLPDSITKLYHLQTLRLGDVEYFPDEMRNLISLRHLYFRAFDDMMMPLKLGSLTYLQTLRFFVVGEAMGRQIKELGSLENLNGKLEIWNLEKVRSEEDAKSANLSRKTKIDELIFVWNRENERDSNINEDVLKGLQPHPNLKSLCLVGYEGDNFPDWVMNMVVNVGSRQLLLENLVDIRLSRCDRVEGIPMLGQLPLLRRLRLERMGRIKYICESFYGYKSSSSRYSCGGETIILFLALKELVLHYMWNLDEWMGATTSKEEVVVFPCLEKLTVEGCKKLKTAPTHFPSLKELRFEHVDSGSPLVSICNKLTTLTSLTIKSVLELTSLPDGLFRDKRHHLVNLWISNCEMLESLPQDLQSCTSLRSLTVRDCRNLKSISSLEGLNSLTFLDCVSCKMLESLPQGLQSCKSLDHLNVSNCSNLKSIPSLEGVKSLTTLDCSGCEMLESLPQGLQSCTSLHYLAISNCNNLNLTVSVKDVTGCPKVISLPLYLSSLTRLETLSIGGRTSSLAMDFFKDIQQLQQWVCLRRLTLIGEPECDTLPEQLTYLIALTSIQLESFGVETLPDWFEKLKCLEEINLWHMEKLKYLPKSEVMLKLTKLRRLHIQNCPLLKARCKEGGRPEWSKISTIPNVRIR